MPKLQQMDMKADLTRGNQSRPREVANPFNIYFIYSHMSYGMLTESFDRLLGSALALMNLLENLS